jgi:hypothetical protein
LKIFCMAAWATSTLGSHLPLQAARAGDDIAKANAAIAIARGTARRTRFDVTDPTGTAAT